MWMWLFVCLPFGSMALHCALAKERSDQPHPHMVMLHPDNAHVCI